VSTYIKISTLEYPLHEGDIRLAFSDIPQDLTGDAFPCPEGYAPVVIPEPPNVNWAVQLAYPSAPACIDGVWSIAWNVRDFTQEELDNIQAHKDAAEQEHGIVEPDLTVSGSAPNVIA